MFIFSRPPQAADVFLGNILKGLINPCNIACTISLFMTALEKHDVKKM
jgi:hypothetical protein